MARATKPTGSARPRDPSSQQSGTEATENTDRLGRLITAVEATIAGPVDALGDAQVSTELSVLEQQVRRLQARQHVLTEALTARAASRRERQGHSPNRARSRAEQETRQQLADQLKWHPAQAADAHRIGQHRGRAPAVADALDKGRLSQRHASLLVNTVTRLPEELRDRATERLLDAAQRQAVQAFGNTCRRLVAELAPEIAERDHKRRHTRRRLRISASGDGFLQLSGALPDMDGEIVASAIDAFRRPDSGSQDRRAEQATADALVELARAALRAGEAPTRHGVRPHVVVTVDAESLQSGVGTAEGCWMGPLPLSQTRRMLQDAALSAVIHDASRVPVEVTTATRTVPQGLYRALLARDGGCIFDGCDAPAGWCDVMHLEHPYRHEGRLSLANGALGCRRHHRGYDSGSHTIEWDDRGRPTMRARSSGTGAGPRDQTGRPPGRDPGARRPGRNPGVERPSARTGEDPPRSDRARPDAGWRGRPHEPGHGGTSAAQPARTEPGGPSGSGGRTEPDGHSEPGDRCGSGASTGPGGRTGPGGQTGPAGSHAPPRGPDQPRLVEVSG